MRRLQNGVLIYTFINLFQSHFDLFYVKFDLRRIPRFLQIMTTLLTGDLIRAARALIGLSQTQLAEKAGVTQKALSEFELSKKPITAKANEKLRRVFEEHHVQFLASNSDTGQLDGTGVRWKPKHPNLGIKLL